MQFFRWVFQIKVEKEGPNINLETIFMARKSKNEALLNNLTQLSSIQY